MSELEEGAFVANGWALYGHPVFIERLFDLFGHVEDLLCRDATASLHSPEWKLLECVWGCMISRIPSDPNHTDFRQGGTLGSGYKNWRRAKNGMPNRYRLFFQFQSTAPKSITYAWFNDEKTLRKAGAKSDCYVVFRRMLERGKIPTSYDELKAEAEDIPAGLNIPGKPAG